MSIEAPHVQSFDKPDASRVLPDGRVELIRLGGLALDLEPSPLGDRRS